ncbi:hypothetical protein [Acinetobacter baumannii]
MPARRCVVRQGHRGGTWHFRKDGGKTHRAIVRDIRMQPAQRVS